MKALFVHDPDDLDASVSGGVQLCSREYLAVLRAAAPVVEPFPVARDLRPLSRLRRRLGLGSYLSYAPDLDAERLSRALALSAITHVFINRAELLRYAALVRRLAPAARVVLMSHGNQSGDDLYEIAGPGGRRNSGRAARLASARLARDLVVESRFRHGPLDAVVAMSEEEAVLERWLGARRVVVLPRLLAPDPLPWRPVAGRMGYVGTLDHTPNRVAVTEICTELARLRPPAGMELRLAGSPAAVGEHLARAYPFVKYLGRINDDALRAEAATWSLFLNPVLWLSRGASMKLGSALRWGLPVLSTRSGARGYEPGGAPVPLCQDNAADFATRALRLLAAPGELDAARAASVAACASAPDLAALAARLRSALSDDSVRSAPSCAG